MDAVSGSQLEKISDEVDAIYSPYAFSPEDKETISSAVLSVDLKDLTDFTVCFAFMVDGLADVPSYPDTITFWHMLASFSFDVSFDALLIEDGSFAPY